jgi:membrane protein required for colicin V production
MKPPALRFTDMLIDLVFVALLVMAGIKGFQRGLIIAVFSVVAFIVGLAAAMKLSAVVAGYLQNSVNISAKWLPLAAFFVVLLVVVLLVRWGARLIEKSVQFAMLGWVNRIGGILLYAALYTTILSVLLFYAEKISLLTPQLIAESKTYPLIQPFGPKAINALGTVLPFFKNMFEELQQFFGTIAQKAS